MDGLIRRLDWAATPVGARADWSPALRQAVAQMLASPQPMFLWWGEALVQFYNDAYRELLGPALHPWLLGGSGRADYHMLWWQVAPQIDAVMGEGLITVEGEKHRRERRIISPAVSWRSFVRALLPLPAPQRR